MTKTFDTLVQKGVTSDTMQDDFLGRGILADVAEAIVSGTVPTDRIAFRKILGLASVLVIDYRMSLNAMILAGRYGQNGNNWNKDITADRFPIVGTGIEEWEFKLFGEGFEDGISSENVIKIITEDDKENPWEPAQTQHTLAFGAQFPNEQLKYPIAGLGSVAEVNGSRHVLCLREVGSKRDLDLPWFDDDWSAYYRFLAVRKVSRPSVS